MQSENLTKMVSPAKKSQSQFRTTAKGAAEHKFAKNINIPIAPTKAENEKIEKMIAIKIS